jgi:DNA-binding SARP family transcriptional activator/predicted ATPase
MARLSMYLLGPFQVTLDGGPVTSFKYDHVRALLAYLAVEADRPHRRERLAGLLWPEQPDPVALSNLRYALYHLRQAIGDHEAMPSFLFPTRETLQFNTASDHWLDVSAFEQHITDSELASQRVSESAIRNLESAIELYRGRFMEGFFLRDCPLFEEWLLFKQEHIDRQMLSALHRLTQIHAALGEYERAEPYARRLLALEPWDEEAHRQLMHLLALSGRRGAALAQYETCRRLLAEELGVDPADETTALHERIRSGEVVRVGAWESTSPPLHPHTPTPSAPFVAREHELARLDEFLRLALAGQGRVVFVTGEAGSGKTVLIGEFAHRAMATHRNLIVTGGKCNAHAGIGDPYLPFREVLQMLTGDIESRQASGAITPEHARRLWAVFPDAVQALANEGPDLMGRFLPGEALVLRAEAFAPGDAAWRSRLEELAKRQEARADLADSTQADLFEQVTQVLKTLARQYPLVLVLDDLQWADSGTVSLLFHLGRRLAGSRILIVGAYRPGNVAVNREEGRHFLEPIINEFQRDWGDIQVDLEQAEHRQFMEAFLDCEPNCLGVTFRETLYQHTEGQALFTVELLRALQERGELVRDKDGRWVEGPSLDWGRLPARVEAVIAERIRRLPEEWQATLAAASVEGEEFTAEVVASVQELDEGEILRRLSGPLSKQHRLVRAHSLRRVDGRRLSCYRFRHILFQSYLYRSLDEVEQARLHEAVGEALETLCAGSADELEALSPRLAWHFEAAGLPDKAIDYLLQAGRRAARLAANEDALGHFRHGLVLLRTLPQSAERGRQELEFQLALGGALVLTRGWGAGERAIAFARAVELSQRTGEITGILRAMTRQADQCRAAGECDRSRALGEQMLELAGRTGKPLHLALAHYTVGISLRFCGELLAARSHLAQCVALEDVQRDRDLTMFLGGADLETMALSWLSEVLWGLGYPEQSLRCSQQALARATELAHPVAVGLTLITACLMLAALQHDDRAVRKHLVALAQVNADQDNAFFRVWQTVFHGWLQARQGKTEAGIAAMRHSTATWEASGSRSGLPFQWVLLAEAYLRSGQSTAGLAVVAEALDLVEQSGLRFLEAELWRLRGELLQKAEGEERSFEDRESPKECFQRAIEVAQKQGAKLWELRATMSLARLLNQQGRVEEAHRLLADICGWFSEGFDTPDLQDAQTLLEELVRWDAFHAGG